MRQKKNYLYSVNIVAWVVLVTDEDMESARERIEKRSMNICRVTVILALIVLIAASRPSPNAI